MGTITDGGNSHRYLRFGGEALHPASAGGIGFALDLDGDTGAKVFYRSIINGSVYLHPILPLVRKFRIQQAMIQLFVIGQQQKSFAVEIQAAYGIHVRRHGKEILQGRLSFPGSELGQHVERLIYDEIPGHYA